MSKEAKRREQATRKRRSALLAKVSIGFAAAAAMLGWLAVWLI